MPRRAAGVLVVLILAACSTPTDEVELPPPATTDPSVALVPPSYQLVPMALTLTWQPDDSLRYHFLDRRWQEYLGERPVDEWRLSYDTARLTLQITGRDLSGHELLQPDLASPPAPVTMLGTAAQMRTSPYGHEQFWIWYLTEPDGSSILVSGTDPEIVERFASGLRREPQEIFAPFEVGLLPEGFVPMHVASHAMEFSSSSDCCASYVAIFLVEPDPTQDFPGTPATVGGNPAKVLVRDGVIAVHIGLPDGSELRVSASSELGLDEAQILQIAEGVRVTSSAVPLPSA